MKVNHEENGLDDKFCTWHKAYSENDSLSGLQRETKRRNEYLS